MTKQTLFKNKNILKTSIFVVAVAALIAGWQGYVLFWLTCCMPLYLEEGPSESAAVARQQNVYIDSPQKNASVSEKFKVVGWAFDTGGSGGPGPGWDIVRVVSGTDCTSSNILGESVNTVYRPDVREHFQLDEFYNQSGFEVEVESSMQGPILFTVCIGIKQTNTFFASSPLYLEESPSESPSESTAVARQQNVYIDSPQKNASVSEKFKVVGWAFDTGGSGGPGPGWDIVRVVSGTDCTSSNILGESVNTVYRPDVREHFQLDEFYNQSGFEVEVESSMQGPILFTVCIGIKQTNTFFASSPQNVVIETE